MEPSSRQLQASGSTRDTSSLRWRLSWLFAMAALISVTVFGVLTYRAVRTSALDASKARLRSVLMQVKSIIDLGMVNQLDSLTETARDADVIAALKSGGSGASPAVVARLRRLQGTAGDAVIVELVTDAGVPVVVLPTGAEPQVTPPGFRAATAAMMGPMVRSHGATTFSAAVPVYDGTVRLGHVLVTRRLSVNSGSANRRIVVNQLGEEARLLIGNRNEGLWNETGLVPYAGAPDQPVVYDRDGQRWISVSAEVGGTSWVYAVELPERVAVAGANALIAPLFGIGLAISVAAAVIGARVSRRITTPLESLSAAADAISRGARSVELSGLDRADEIGRLSRAFAAMHTSVRTVRDQLEADVDSRTADLTTAVGRLRELDDELRKSERFAALGRLSGNVGHELRNPLGVMSTVVFMLDALPDASPKLREYANLLREQIRLSERIISDMLDRARSGAPQVSNVDVVRLVADVVSHASVPESITVVLATPGDVPCVAIDADHVRQILWNLINNAVQAMRGGQGSLTVTTTHQTGRLRIEVRDTGPGVAPAHTARLFEPMFTTKGDGVGLGLAISRALARANGGDLLLVDQNGTGAVFLLDLPAAPCQTFTQ